MSKTYMKRIADRLLRDRLTVSGAVLIEGPKWCGKTRTALEISKSHLLMQDPDKASSYLKIADTKPSLLLAGDTPRLLDEWQTALVLWDAVRFMVDQRGEPGQFILTGSAVPADNAVQHTGTGRISRLMMRPMSLCLLGIRHYVPNQRYALPQNGNLQILPLQQLSCVSHHRAYWTILTISDFSLNPCATEICVFMQKQMTAVFFIIAILPVSKLMPLSF